MKLNKFVALTVAFFCMVISLATIAQTGNDMTYRAGGVDYVDSTKIPSSRMKQQRDYLSYQAAFPAKPRNMWEIGLVTGVSHLWGSDVPVVFFPWSGYGLTGNYGLTVRKALGYSFSIRGELNHALVKGTSWQLYSGYTEANPTQSVWNNSGYINGQAVVSNYRTALNSANLDLVYNLGNLMFHKPNNKWNMDLFFGLGYGKFKGAVNTLDADSNMYDFTTMYANATAAAGGYSWSNRKEIVKELMTQMGTAKSDYNEDINPSGSSIGYNGQNAKGLVSGGMGVKYLVSPKISLGIEDRLTYWNTDWLDGQARSEKLWWNPSPQGQLSSSKDFSNNINITLGYHLGSTTKNILPLWWVNPNSYTYGEISTPRHSVSRPTIVGDEDGDGVQDDLDQEKNTPAGCPVNTHGVSLDTDGDGVADCRDKELITPTYCQPVDINGVGKCPSCENCIGTTGDVNQVSAECINPTDISMASAILSSSNITILQSLIPTLKSSTCKIVVEGFGDSDKKAQQRSWDKVNQIINYLSEVGGISKDRFIFSFGKSGPVGQVKVRPANSGETGQSNIPPPFPHLIGQ